MFEQLFDPGSSTYTYLIACDRTRAACLVDPVLEQLPAYRALLAERALTLGAVLETHLHADHVTAAAALREAYQMPTLLPARAQVACADRMLGAGDRIEVGDQVLTVLETPGHTLESLSYVCGAGVLTGDSLLIDSCGRTDFQGGDPGELYDSIYDQLFRLPDETAVWPAHDYHGRTSSTIGHERRTNARVAGKSREEFIALMKSLKLPPPARMDTAIPANQRCGRTS